MQEQLKVTDLVHLLRESGKSSETDIVNILSQIIQFHILYGGSLTDSIAHKIDNVKRSNP